jgi:hypothetical protein
MAQKTHTGGDAHDQPNAASSSTKASPDSGTNQIKSSSRVSSPTPASQQQAQPSEQKDSIEDAVDAQLLNKATSGSDQSGKDPMAGPSPYGTRSRNRGQARPNYAEDKDVDIEMYDAYPEKKEEPKKSSRQVSAASNGVGDAPKPLGPGSRKSAALEDGKSGHPGTTTTTTTTTTNTATKDAQANHAATTNVASGTAATGLTKKRKAAGQANLGSAQTPSTAAPSASSTPGTTRRGANQAVTSSRTGGYKETNLLTFEDSGAVPKDGRLVADDGTVLELNGKAGRGIRCSCIAFAGSLADFDYPT